MELWIWRNFIKKKNSTKQPNPELAVKRDVKLKESTSLEQPTFLLDVVDFDYNFCYFAGHYYFINDIVINTFNVYELQCTQDVLATYKNDIGSSSQFVLRAQSMYDDTLLDTLYPATTTIASQFSYLTPKKFPDTEASLSYGVYILGVFMSNNQVSDNVRGGVSYFEVSRDDMQAFSDYLLSNEALEVDLNINSSLLTESIDILSDVISRSQKALINPIQYVVSCKWYPILADSAASFSQVNCGTFTRGGTGVTRGIPLTSGLQNRTFTQTVNVPKHPQADTRGRYLNCAPYTTHMLLMPQFGRIDLDATILRDIDSINVVTSVDLISGIGHVFIYAGNTCIADRVAQMGVDIQLGQVATNWISGTQAILGASGSAVGSVASLNPAAIASVPFNIGSGVLDALQAWRPQLNSSGANGGAPDYFILESQLISEFIGVSGEDIEHLGRPLERKVTISSLSGYILCQNANVDIAGYSDDKNLVNSYLNTGFYYE